MYKSISYVIPILNEELNIKRIIQEISKSFDKNDLEKFEIIFVDDGSKDASVDLIKKFIKEGYPIKCICLTRNFGHQQALTAGLEHAKTELIAVLDGDLQDPPIIINKFIKELEKGYEVVYGIRKKRKETIFNNNFYRFRKIK